MVRRILYDVPRAEFFAQHEAWVGQLKFQRCAIVFGGGAQYENHVLALNRYLLLQAPRKHFPMRLARIKLHTQHIFHFLGVVARFCSAEIDRPLVSLVPVEDFRNGVAVGAFDVNVDASTAAIPLLSRRLLLRGLRLLLGWRSRRTRLLHLDPLLFSMSVRDLLLHVGPGILCGGSHCFWSTGCICNVPLASYGHCLCNF